MPSSMEKLKPKTTDCEAVGAKETAAPSAADAEAKAAKKKAAAEKKSKTDKKSRFSAVKRLYEQKYKQ